MDYMQTADGYIPVVDDGDTLTEAKCDWPIKNDHLRPCALEPDHTGQHRDWEWVAKWPSLASSQNTFESISDTDASEILMNACLWLAQNDVYLANNIKHAALAGNHNWPGTWRRSAEEKRLAAIEREAAQEAERERVRQVREAEKRAAEVAEIARLKREKKLSHCGGPLCSVCGKQLHHNKVHADVPICNSCRREAGTFTCPMCNKRFYIQANARRREGVCCSHKCRDLKNRLGPKRPVGEKQRQVLMRNHMRQRKLTDDQVREVRRLGATNMPQCEISRALELSVSLTLVNNVILGRSYRDVI